jgi:hypothetical protein
MSCDSVTAVLNLAQEVCLNYIRGVRIDERSRRQQVTSDYLTRDDTGSD